jgi:dTDP-4-amino-4,6-dideoxygalactose transaminase
VTRILIPQADPGASYFAHKAEIDAAVGEVLSGGWYILGTKVAKFEQAFARFIGVEQAIGVGNGTDAIVLALRVGGVGDGDTVFTVSHTAVATVAAIELVGAVPVFVDIDPVSFTMDPARLETAIRQTETKDGRKAVIPVHIYGHPVDMPAIMEIANRHNLYVVEDCAQAHGAKIQGRSVGAWGHIAAFSFYPTKNLGAFGDGGMVTTNDAKLADVARAVREYGWRERYISERRGMNTRLDELQAAILTVKLRYLEEENTRRRDIARLYDAALKNSDVRLPVSRQSSHVYHQYVIRSSNRDAFRERLKKEGISTALHYPLPVHEQPAYAGRVTSPDGLPQTELISKEIVSLPMFGHMTEQQVLHVCAALERVSG